MLGLTVQHIWLHCPPSAGAEWNDCFNIGTYSAGLKSGRWKTLRLRHQQSRNKICWFENFGNVKNQNFRTFLVRWWWRSELWRWCHSGRGRSVRCRGPNLGKTFDSRWFETQFGRAKFVDCINFWKWLVIRKWVKTWRHFETGLRHQDATRRQRNEEGGDFEFIVLHLLVQKWQWHLLRRQEVCESRCFADKKCWCPSLCFEPGSFQLIFKRKANFKLKTNLKIIRVSLTLTALA